MAQIEVRGLTKVFGPNPRKGLKLAREGMSKDELLAETGHVLAVDDVSFDVAQGELFVVMGLSGSGKSTVIRMLNRLIEPTDGTVDLDGERVSDMSESRLRRMRAEKMSMVFQHFALFPHRTVGQNAGYGLKIQGVGESERNDRAEAALERVGLAGWFDRYPGEMSGGMKQRVGIARGLATEADILLMDEPFSALDPLIRRDMQDLLMELQDELSRTIVFITHDLNEAMRIGDRIIVMKDGATVQIGTGEEIIHQPANQYVRDFVADVDRSRVLTAALAMREPHATFTPDSSPNEILEHFAETDTNGAYVLDPDGRILGVARDVQVARAVEDGAERIEDYLIQDYATALPSTLLEDLSAIAAQHAVAIAVIDDEGHLEGIVPRPSLLRALAGEERMSRQGGSPEGVTESHEEVPA